MREKFDGTCYSFGSRFGDIDCVTSVVLWRTANVPPIDAVWGPCFAFLWVFVHHYFCSGWREGCLVVVHGAVELCFCGKARIDV